MAQIVQVAPRYSPYIGGLEIHVQSISERLNRDFQVKVLSTDPKGHLPKDDTVNGVAIKRFRSWAPNEAYYFSFALKKYLSKNILDSDIVHAHGYHAFPALYAAQTKAKNKLVFTSHYHGEGHTFFRNLLMLPYKLIANKIFNRADRVICVSQYEKTLVTKNFRNVKEKIVVIPNGLNLKEFEDLKKQQKKDQMILCVARLEKYKGIQFLLQALPKLSNDIHLEIVGKGPFEEDLKRLAVLKGIQERVTFFKDLPRHLLLQKYADANLFALLSTHEAYGLVVAEALAAKTPCIVCKSSALEEWVDNKNCFGISNPINLDELTEVIKLGMERKINVVNIPDWNEVVASLTKLYTSLS